MCGIFGFWLNRPLNERDIREGRDVLAKLAHRGPDGTGEWFDREKGIFFGHRRLAIVDLSPTGAQPMHRDSLVITYNGEIYNFVEIRRVLAEQGAVFSGTSDTEVLLAAWQKWGSACLDKFDGMFAYALFDGSRLYLGTDLFGEKPLYVATMPDGIYFCSEPGPLIDLLKLEFRPTKTEVCQVMALGFIPPPGTGYAGLSWLPPAVVKCYETPQRSRETVYWAPPSSHGGKRNIEKGDVDRLRDILVESLSRRVRADVPVGLFLSSGVDSTLIGALASRELGISLRSLTVSFADGVDEAEAARAIAGHLKLPHRVVDSRVDDAWRELPKSLVDIYRVPNDNVTALSVEQMSRLAKSEFTVALGGVGGDEAFYGYNKYAFVARHRLAYSLPQGVIRALSTLLRWHPRLSTMERMLNGSPSERFLTLKNVELSGLIRTGAMQAPPLPGFRQSGGDMIAAMQSYDIANTLPGSYVAAVDRGSMRASVEVRTPYLARSVFEFASEFDPVAMTGREQKALLKGLLRRYLPAELVDRPKRGFVFPLRRYMDIATNRPRVPYLSESAMSDLWDRRRRNGADVLVLRAMILDHLLRS